MKIKELLREYVNMADTPAFKTWFGNSKVVDKSGKPLRVYHGTTHNFSVFGYGNGDKEGYHGAANYFTSSPRDADKNYSGIGPDLKSRLDLRSENIMAEWEDNSEDFPDYNSSKYKALERKSKAQAKQELVGPVKRYIMPCYLKIEKPVILSAKGGTYFELDYDEGTGEESGSGSELYDAFMRVVGDQNIWEQVEESSQLYDGCSADDFEAAVREHDDLMDNDLSAGEVLSDIYKIMGFDGIILDTSITHWNMKNMPAGTTHYVVWNANQIKSSIGNKGTFSTNSLNITEDEDANQ
jgi:hypothetical protein